MSIIWYGPCWLLVGKSTSYIGVVDEFEVPLVKPTLPVFAYRLGIISPLPVTLALCLLLQNFLQWRRKTFLSRMIETHPKTTEFSREGWHTVKSIFVRVFYKPLLLGLKPWRQSTQRISELKGIYETSGPRHHISYHLDMRFFFSFS